MFKFTVHLKKYLSFGKNAHRCKQTKNPEWRSQGGASWRPPPRALTQVEFTGPLRGQGIHKNNVALVRILIFYLRSYRLWAVSCKNICNNYTRIHLWLRLPKYYLIAQKHIDVKYRNRRSKRIILIRDLRSLPKYSRRAPVVWRTILWFFTVPSTTWPLSGPSTTWPYLFHPQPAPFWSIHSLLSLCSIHIYSMNILVSSIHYTAGLLAPPLLPHISPLNACPFHPTPQTLLQGWQPALSVNKEEELT